MVIDKSSVNNNMQIYEYSRKVPTEAQKEFNNGRMKGTDINPMWRIRMLTELFGPSGIGWYTDVLEKRIEPVGDSVIVTVDINLFVRDPETKQWSRPIFGTGGNMLVAKGRPNDEGFKMAYTDALSVACKALGIGADVYWGKDKTKYTMNTESTGNEEPKETKPEPNYKPDAPKMTADAAAVDASPIDGDPDHVSQVKLTKFIEDYIKNFDRDQKMKVSAKIKEFNGGSANFRTIENAETRKKIYDFFWNQANAIA